MFSAVSTLLQILPCEFSSELSVMIASAIERLLLGRAIAQVVNRRLPSRRPRFDLRAGHVGFVVDQVTLGGRFSPSNSVSPAQLSFHRLLHTPHYLSFVAGTVGQIVADVPSGLSLTPPQDI
jgi:hypothetical protein